jgi:hypothetical protein
MTLEVYRIGDPGMSEEELRRFWDLRRTDPWEFARRYPEYVISDWAEKDFYEHQGWAADWRKDRHQ